MNITVLANRDLASNYALNLLLPRLAVHKVSLFLSGQVGGSSARPWLDELRFYEQELPNELVFPGLSTEQNQQGELLSFDGLSRFLLVAPQPLNDVKQASSIAAISSREPDLIISIRFGFILKDDVLAIPQHGCLNLHSGLLPDYPGVMASFWAMSQGATELGSSLHFIDSEAIDKGPIVARQHQPLTPGACYLENVLSLYPSGCEAIVQAVDTIDQGCSLEAEPQAASQNYYSFPTAVDVEQFLEKGHRWVDKDFCLEFMRRYLPMVPTG